MVVSSAMRIGTQDLMFRTGMVSPPGGAEREIGRGEKGGAKGENETKGTDALPKGTGGNGKPTGKSTTAPKNTNGSTGNGKGTTNGKRPGTGKKPSTSKAASNGQADNGSSDDEETPAAKPHPRSRSKKERKAR